MIVYALTCNAGHAFEGWYGSADAFEKLRDAGHLECPACGSKRVEKLPSAPYVHTHGSAAPSPPPSEPDPNAAAIRTKAIGELRAFLLKNTEDVGREFAEIAKRIHYGEEEQRGIRGSVTPDEAAELQDEGVDAFAVSSDLGLDEIQH
ncbi:DUF1178 family protein [Usitatibacter palustris]|uniref:DUF1178 domain-containing protein n=1 Tax=Usitatibacter palustris TaxID=2732487 RepID=A0A6M4H9T8_9PROT|nr:DUF1178 family protein [Usitatibacter palustris]QJR15164.1 hypothetical protein DSM104440_01981 [Usitatibacter palustris]